MVRNGIPRICIYFGSTERNSELCSLLQKGSEQNYGSLPLFLFHGTEFRVVFSSAEGFGTEFRDFLFRGTTGIPSELTICSVYSVFRGINFLSEIPNPKWATSNICPLLVVVALSATSRRRWIKTVFFYIKIAIFLLKLISFLSCTIGDVRTPVSWMMGSKADSTLTSMSSPLEAVRSLRLFLILASTLCNIELTTSRTVSKCIGSGGTKFDWCRWERSQVARELEQKPFCLVWEKTWTKKL